ncbi:MAG: hypothetical protein V4691_03770 [Pseudomonadota bacterium]
MIFAEMIEMHFVSVTLELKKPPVFAGGFFSSLHVVQIKALASAGFPRWMLLEVL